MVITNLFRKPGSSRQLVLIFLFGFTIFSSAFLLFQIQLLIAKYILPWFGGTPATFTTCMLFFQVLLLLGYLYAHVTSVHLGSRSQVVVHSILVAGTAVLLAWQRSIWGTSLLPGDSWKPVNSSQPVMHILAVLSVSVALPYFVASTTSPLLQAWYARSFRGTPYRLYGLSNAGSLIGLLSYPILVEPLVPLRMQARIWAAGFLVFGITCLTIAWRSARTETKDTLEPVEPDSRTDTSRPTWYQKLAWLLLPAVASLALLATTNQICQDVAVVPLLWVVPLSLYLCSFILCFSFEHGYSRAIWSVGLGLATLLLCFVLYNPSTGILRQIFIYSFALFAVCMVCHGELARLTPAKKYLTSFYLYLAAGGALGGFFVTIIAPIVFRGLWEFHLSIWLCWTMFCLMLLRDKTSWIYIPKPILLAFAILLILYGPVAASLATRQDALLFSSFMAAGLIAFMFSGNSRVDSERERRRVAIFSVLFVSGSIGALVAYPPAIRSVGTILNARNFYGVVTVIPDVFEGSPRRVLRHGKITHGFQFAEESKRRIPTSYFAPESGIGLVLGEYPKRASDRTLRVGVIGLGVGTLAAYGTSGESMRFYEINPEVIKLATPGPDEIFTFLSDSHADVSVVPGDARLSLEYELRGNRGQEFDVLVVDAFSGDTIPVHLLTKEAFQLYLRHLAAPNGILAFHISNNAVDLRPVISRLAQEFQMSALLAQTDAPYRSAWLIITANNRTEPVPGVEHMTRVAPNPEFPLWTDDYTNLLQVLRW